jgi:nuclear pore complex protein Nup107
MNASGSGRVQLAKSVHDLLPPELSSIRDPEERSTEYLHYRQFFKVWDTLDRVIECEAMEVPQMAKDTRTAWLSDYTVCIELSMFA